MPKKLQFLKNTTPNYFLKNILFIFRKKGREGERQGNINMWFPLMCSLLRTWPAIQAYALTGN